MTKVVAGIMRHPEEARYLVGLRLGPTLGGCWEFPGGKVELNESEETALRREWQEEMGWNIIVKEEVYYNEFTHTELGKFSITAYSVDLIENGLAPKYNAHTQFAWMTLNEMLFLPENLVTPSLKSIVRSLSYEIIDIDEEEIIHLVKGKGRRVNTPPRTTNPRG